MMRIEELLLSGKSERANRFFINMLKWLDNPKRKRYNDPMKLLVSSGIQPGQTVLEIGCGSGYFTEYISKILGEKGKLYAVDIHPIAVRETQKKVDALELSNVVVKQDNAMASSFDEEMFDLVILYGVVPAPVISMKDITKEIYRLLKPGGSCAIWTMVPFWSPRSALKYASFKRIRKNKGVFCLQKK